MPLVWQRTPGVAFPALADAYAAAIHRGVVAIAQRRAPEIADWMKENAPWQNITGEARRTLRTEVEELAGGMVKIILAGGVEYFVFLELSNAGRFSIISPALDYWTPRVWADVRALLR